MDEQSSTGPAHQPGTHKGEELNKAEGPEAGREEKTDDGTGRPAATSTARYSTGINPEAEDPIDPSMPHMPPA
ncbi:MAG: hypothetical protein M3Z04_10045 [Chloroflexota bacterium]|nr:hypothetical protein [Chloroflexota bacterium]